MGQRKVASRSAQWPLLAEFYFNFDDTVVDTSGAVKNLGAAGTTAFVAIPLPPGAIIEGGEVCTEVGWTPTSAYTVAVGDVGPPVTPAVPVPNRYLAATAALALGTRTPIIPTGYVSQGENLMLTIVATGGPATAGRSAVRVWYVIRDRANEVNPT